MNAPPAGYERSYDTWLVIHKRWFRWHWELRNLVGYVWAEGNARSFPAAREAGWVRNKVGPTSPLPTRPDPGMSSEAFPRLSILPLRRHIEGSLLGHPSGPDATGSADPDAGPGGRAGCGS